MRTLADIAADVRPAGFTFRVVRSADVLYLRAAWTATKDLVQRIALNTTGPSYTTNGLVAFTGVRLVPVATLNTALVAAYDVSTDVLANQGDEAAPANYNGTYIGGNHGPAIVFQITMAGHGKTAADVGSEWTDTIARHYYIARIVDANTLIVVPKNTGTAALWAFAGSISGGVLVHFAGATHTADIVFTYGGAGTQIQWLPIVQNLTRTLRIDGVTGAATDDVHGIREAFEITETYDIANPASAVGVLAAGVGGWTDFYPNHASAAPQARMTVTYRFAENGSCTVYHSFRAYQDLTLAYVGFTQASVPVFAGKSLYFYVPRVNAIVGGIKTWNLSSLEDITTQIETLNLVSTTWADANNPPDRMVQIVKSGGVASFGYMTGFSPQRGVGLPATRKTLVNDAAFIATTRKMYPKGISTGGSAIGIPVTAGSVYDAVAFRVFYPCADVPEATVLAWYADGSDVVLTIDFHSTIAFKRIPLPRRFTGKSITVIDKSASFTLHGTGVISDDGILVSSSGSAGYGVLRIAP